MSVDTQSIAREFSLSEGDLLKKSLRAFLLEQLRLFETERKARCAKFGATNVWDMERLMVEGKVEEEDILEDFQKVDYLTTRVERVKAMLEEL